MFVFFQRKPGVWKRTLTFENLSVISHLRQFKVNSEQHLVDMPVSVCTVFPYFEFSVYLKLKANIIEV